MLSLLARKTPYGKTWKELGMIQLVIEGGGMGRGRVR